METPTERTRSLGFKNQFERHKWIVDHSNEIRAYCERHGRTAAMKEYHIGASTVQWLMGETSKAKEVEKVS